MTVPTQKFIRFFLSIFNLSEIVTNKLFVRKTQSGAKLRVKNIFYVSLRAVCFVPLSVANFKKTNNWPNFQHRLRKIFLSTVN